MLLGNVQVSERLRCSYANREGHLREKIAKPLLITSDLSLVQPKYMNYYNMFYPVTVIYQSI